MGLLHILNMPQAKAPNNQDFGGELFKTPDVAESVVKAAPPPKLSSGSWDMQKLKK